MSQVPKKGRTEQEFRIESLFGKLHLNIQINHVYCFACHNHYQNPLPDAYPNACRICFIWYNEKGQYCLPDFIISNGERKGVLYVNGSIHEKEKQRKKDRYQVSELRLAGIKVFVINNSEIDNMTDATLTAYLKSVYRAVADDGLYEAMYKAEKEYPCLR